MISEQQTAARRVIRTALPMEATAVAELHARARATYYPDGVPEDGVGWSAAWATAIRRPEGQVLCAVEDGRIVAIASFRTPKAVAADTVKLLQFHVDPEHWRRGHGSALHAACVEAWQADGRRTAQLKVHTENRPAQAFYARLGWVPDPQDPPAEGADHLALRYAVPGDPGE